MPNKTEEYLALARKTADSFSRQWEHWAEFLITAARLYKYSYPDQLMIYAQRPDATACAEYDVWNNKMNRYVRRGSKGIALLDESGGYPRLHYVFDVSDTAPRRNALYPDLWQINESLKEPVRSMLAENYGVHSESFGQQLADVAGKLVQSYWDNNSSDILGIVDGSYLMSYDDAGRELQFKSAAAMGVTYMLLERCGLDPAGWFDEKDFQAVYDFTTSSAVYALGTAVSDCSREVLRQIERTVKTTIRRRNIERSQEEYEQQSELHEDRGLFSAEPDLESAPEAAEPVRKDAPELSDGAAPGGVQHDAAERDPVPAPVGGGTDGRKQDATADERTVGEEPGSGQGEKPDGVGAAHEQPESAGRGNDPDRADLQLSFLEAAIPTEAQQIESIDQAYNKLNFSIHNYFFAKAIDQVRPGGIVAFVTSRYTLDSKDSAAWKHIAERADLLGAIRLPNNAFRANAGTDVVSDIIFLQKRDRPMDHEPAWVQLGKTADGIAINSYFADHPEMILGELTTESTQYGKEEATVVPIEGANLADQLREAVQQLEGQYLEAAAEVPDIAETEAERRTLPADPDVKNFSYTVVEGEVYYRENSVMTQVELSGNAKDRVVGMVELRQIVNELIDRQLNDYPEEDIKEAQEQLNAAYDAFTAQYGLLNDRKNGRLFEDDSSYYLLCSLENLDEQGQLKSKADMFTQRTIRPERVVTSVNSPSEALAVSIGEHGKVDLPYMAELLGTPGEYAQITGELSGVIFKDPNADPADPEAGWQMADEYLSGDVRTKLRTAQLAAETNPEFAVNAEALLKAQPKDLEASEIDVRLGATWLAPEIIQKFMAETFQIPYYMRHSINVKFSQRTAEWRIEGKTAMGKGDIMSCETYGTSRANAYKILEETLNLKDVRIYDTIEGNDGKPKRVLNKRETMLAQQKQQSIKDAFANWIWQDPQRRISLVRQYNELFNSTRPREYNGEHIHFVGMNPEISLREHQRNAIAHVLYGGNTLLAHEVGAGKTFEMAASAMEAKRLGLCQKSLFVVPNHLTEQWAAEFLHLYPNAKLLVARRKDFETANRKKFCARIATGDYDAVIIGHSQFERIPLSFERQERIIQEQIDEIQDAISELKYASGERFTVKQMEKSRKNLEQKLEKLRAADRKDDVITFEQLGVDRLFVDESHAFKNLFLYTKMRNVAGLSTSEAQKSSDMFGKCRYLDEVTGGRGVIFATGTPVSNSMTELYTVMRYLQYGTLQKKNLTHFDCWASTFGETTTAIELAPEGTGYRARTRFAKFFNLPELMAMFKELADIKTSDQLHLPVPEAKFETVVVKPSDIQKEMVQNLSERAAKVHSGTVDASEDNMLCITNDGRKIGLDQRLMNPLLPDDPASKLNACVRNVLQIWEDGREQKLTQLLFCDLSTPKNDGQFNVYDDIKTKLLAAGVPESEVAFIHSADTEAKKAALFSKVRSGDVRILLGSTAKMGAGTNVQDRLVAVHHLDVGWKPSDMTQRNGRIIRQGNRNKEVKVFNYVTEGTFDAYLWQTLENKQRFISQIMTSKSPVRSCDDVDEQALSYAEVKALCAGNPLIKEKMDLDVQVAKLKVLKADHQSQKYRLEDKLLTQFPADIQQQRAHISALKTDAETAAAHPQDKENFCGMTIKGMMFDDKKTAGERLILAAKELPDTEPVVLGEYRGFELSVRYEPVRNEQQAVLKGKAIYPVALGADPHGNITRLDNLLAGFDERIANAENRLENLLQQQTAAQAEVEKPFPQEEELAQKSARLAELNAQLDVDEKHHEPEMEETPDEESARPSVLAALNEKSDKEEPVKPFRSYSDRDGDAR